MAETIRQVAARAGVSTATVSRYLSGLPTSQETGSRVARAIEELGYSKNLIAEGLSRRRIMTIGAVVRNVYDIFEASILTEADRVFRQSRYSLIVSSREDFSGGLGAQLDFLLGNGVDGMMVFPQKGDGPGPLEALCQGGIPTVLMDTDVPGTGCDKILVDNTAATQQMVRKLFGLGHRRIGFIGGPPDDYVGGLRNQGFLDACGALDLPVDDGLLALTDYSSAGGYAAALEMLQQQRPPTALCFSNYFTTLGGVKAVQKLGIKVPAQLSIIGFDRFETLPVVPENLSLVMQPTGEIGRLAANLLLQRIAQPRPGVGSVHLLETTLVEGGTVRQL